MAPNPALDSVLRAKEAHVGEQDQRDAIKRELEAEARGLLMAARMHGFMVNVMHGTATVIDARGVRP